MRCHCRTWMITWEAVAWWDSMDNVDQYINEDMLAVLSSKRLWHPSCNTGHSCDATFMQLTYICLSHNLVPRMSACTCLASRARQH